MGQQQLLLLVLSTVIVGLATVAGIQAFSENQAQASQDALVQRGTSIASDIQGLNGKPTQMGGINLDGNSDPDGATIVDKLGYETTDTGDATVPAQGAGSGGECTISTGSGNATISCTSADTPQDVDVTVDPDASQVISTTFTGS